MTTLEEPMTAYWIARALINDPVEYKKYTDRVPEIVEKYQGRILARGGKYEIVEGPQKFHRFVVIEFPSFAQAIGCFRSSEYQKAAVFRREGAGEVEIVILGAGEFTR
jgi:uncharacterized protein (DUF1330 family)